MRERQREKEVHSAQRHVPAFMLSTTFSFIVTIFPLLPSFPPFLPFSLPSFIPSFFPAFLPWLPTLFWGVRDVRVISPAMEALLKRNHLRLWFRLSYFASRSFLTHFRGMQLHLIDPNSIQYSLCCFAWDEPVLMSQKAGVLVKIVPLGWPAANKTHTGLHGDVPFIFILSYMLVKRKIRVHRRTLT